MKRLLSLGVLALLGGAASAQDEVYVRAPLVRVYTAPAGTWVRAPLVNLYVPPARPAATVPAELMPAPTPAPLRGPGPLEPLPPPPPPPPPLLGGPTAPSTQPPLPLPLPAGTLTLEDFARSFQPRGGAFDVTLINPITGQPTPVHFALPDGPPRRVIVRRREVEFDYGPRHFVRIEFDRRGAEVVAR